jgi:methylmalonyl-CoA mutase
LEFPEDIKVKPFYHKDEFTKAFLTTKKLRNARFVKIFFVYDIDKSVERALDSLSRGAESLRFSITDETIDVTKLLEKLPLEALPFIST